MTDLPLVRRCGGCNACCKTHAVVQVSTTHGEWCQHCVIGMGCAIYEQRPVDCRLYECLWFKGKGEERDRPDRLNIVMDGIVVKLGEQEVLVLNLWEVEPGAANQERVRDITEANVAAGLAVRHRLTVPHEVWPLRVVDKIFFPTGMLSPAERERFLEALRDG